MFCHEIIFSQITLATLEERAGPMINYIFTLWIPVGRKDESVKRLIFKMRPLSKTQSKMCLLVCVPLLLQSSRLLWLSLVSCSASLGKSFTGKLILKILCWWICLTFWVFVRSICALVVWDFSYVMVVVCCLILIIVPVVIVAGEWKEYGFVVQAGRRMAYKGTNWVEAYCYIGSCERAANRSWAVFVGRSWDGPSIFLLLGSSICC